VAEAQVSSVKTIGRAAIVLKALAAGPRGGSRLTDIATVTGLGKATVHRLLGALADVGFVDYDDLEKRYRLGYALFALGASARSFHVVDLARPSLVRLAAETGDTVYLSLRDGDEAICVDRRTGSFPIRTLTLDVGDRRPLGIGAGALALLAFDSDEEIARVLRVNAPARRDYAAFNDAALRALIVQARADGYAFNDGNIVSAMSAIGVPVRDGSGRVRAALSIAAIRERFEGERLATLVGLLQKEASELGAALTQAAHTACEQVTGARRTRIREDVA
jgi:DNA-binding IclR family transcriptional regulator